MDVPKYPTGAIRFDGGVLSILGGETVSIPVADITGIESRPAKKKGLLALEVSFRQGVGTATSKMLVSADHQTALDALITAVRQG